jgi:tetratricopeptide (TPR) repeat protein
MKSRLIVTAVLSGLLTPLLYGQETKSEKPTGETKPAAPATMKLYEVPPAREANSQPPEEVADYFKITQTQEPKERVQLIEAFLKQYPESRHASTLHQMATASYQQLNNYEKMVEYGEKTLQALPANPATLSVLALAYAYHGEADKALDRASRSISVLEKLTVPANVDPARFMAERNQYLSSNYASMGSASLTKFEEARKARRDKEAAAVPSVPVVAGNQQTGASVKGGGKLPEPATSGTGSALLPPDSPEVIALAKAYGYFTRSLELNPDYDFARFQLGIVYAYQNKAEQALESFARTVALNGGFAEMARQNLEAIYKMTHKDSLEGLEEFISKFKTQPAPAQEAPK